MIDFPPTKLFNSSNNPDRNSFLKETHHKVIIVELVLTTNHGIPFSTNLHPKYLAWMWICRMYQTMLIPRMVERKEVAEQDHCHKHKENKLVMFEEWELVSVARS
jgi:hypothetical protein